MRRKKVCRYNAQRQKVDERSSGMNECMLLINKSIRTFLSILWNLFIKSILATASTNDPVLFVPFLLYFVVLLVCRRLKYSRLLLFFIYTLKRFPSFKLEWLNSMRQKTKRHDDEEAKKRIVTFSTNFELKLGKLCLSEIILYYLMDWPFFESSLTKRTRACLCSYS